MHKILRKPHAVPARCRGPAQEKTPVRRQTVSPAEKPGATREEQQQQGSNAVGLCQRCESQREQEVKLNFNVQRPTRFQQSMGKRRVAERHPLLPAGTEFACFEGKYRRPDNNCQQRGDRKDGIHPQYATGIKGGDWTYRPTEFVAVHFMQPIATQDKEDENGPVPDKDNPAGVVQNHNEGQEQAKPSWLQLGTARHGERCAHR